MTFSIVDYIVLGFILIFAIIGVCKGLFKMIFSLSKKIIAFIVAYYLAGPVRDLLLPTTIGEKINGSVLAWVTEKIPDLVNITSPTDEQLSTISSSLNLPKFIVELILKAFNDKITTMSIGDTIASTVTYYTLTVLSYVGLFIVISILVLILGSLLNSLFESPILKPINRILGLGLGVLIATLIISLLLLITQSLSSWSFMGDFVQSQIDPTNPSFGVTRFLYNHNILTYAIENVININQIFS